MDNNKKIIIVTDDYPPKSGGGAAIVASIHANGLKKNGFDVIVLTTVEDKNKIGEFDEDGIKVIRIYSKYSPRYRSILSMCNFFILGKVKEIFKKERADIIHFHNIHYHISYCAIGIASLFTKNIFITIHDSMPFHYSKLYPNPNEFDAKSYKTSPLKQLKDFKFRFNPFKNIIVKKYLKIPNKIFAVSNALKNALKDNGINNVEVINNGIDLNKWKINKDEIESFKREFNLFNKKPILFCGRLSNAKGGDVLIKAMPRILKKSPDAMILIVGEKDVVADNMLKSAIELGIDKSIVFTGKLSGNRLINAYGACYMLITPSLCFDWFPTVNLEAMAMKLPIVATCFGGSRESVSNGQSGYIINPYNQIEIIDKVTELLNDENKAKQFGENGYKRAQDLFSIEKYIQNTIVCYNKFSNK